MLEGMLLIIARWAGVGGEGWRGACARAGRLQAPAGSMHRPCAPCSNSPSRTPLPPPARSLLPALPCCPCSQCVQAAQITFEDYFMADLAIPPLKIVG